MLLLGTVAGMVAPAAIAGSFSAPVRLPGKFEGWQFAVNDRGEAVGVHGSEAGAIVLQLGRSGQISGSWLVSAPAHVGSVGSSIVLGDRGEVAVGILYGDGQLEPSNEYHGGPGCCDHIAIASWQLGAPPPVAQAVSPQLDASMALADQPSVPTMVIGGSTITALWTRGVGDEEPGEAQIEQAFGQVGGPLHTEKLLTVPSGVPFLDLHLAPDGRPVASWVDDGDKIRTVTGRPTGAVSSPMRVQQIPKLGSGIGFAHDDQGDTMFAYLSHPSDGQEKLMMMTSSTGGRFTNPRAIASIPPETGEVLLAAGGHRSLLAIWTHTRLANLTEHFEARRGSVFGSFGRQVQVDETYFPDEEATGFVDSRGRSVIIHRGPAAHHPRDFGLEAFTAQPGRPFGHPHRIAPKLRDCGLNNGEELEVEPIATSPNGRAIFDVTCDEGSGQRGSQYLIRYTPYGLRAQSGRATVERDVSGLDGS